MDAPDDGADGLMGVGTGLVEEVGRRGDHPGLRVGHAGERAAGGRVGPRSVCAVTKNLAEGKVDGTVRHDIMADIVLLVVVCIGIIPIPISSIITIRVSHLALHVAAAPLFFIVISMLIFILILP